MSNEEIAGLNDFLNCHNVNTREKWMEFTKEDIFRPKFDISIRDQKELALERLKIIAKNKVFSVSDFEKDPLNVFTNHECAGMVDGSVATKMTVQLNLFGGTVYTLGTERHRAVAEGVDTLSTIGCFALTELGFGNNAVQMETTAHYDKEKQTFTINSPTVLSQKYWITNGAYHCNYAIVFAQLIMPGNVNEGVHAFLCRIRNEDGSVKKGVFIEDMGCKFGLNGVDNGRLKFTNLVIPREGLLNKFSDVSPEGVYTSDTKNKRNRFLKIADRLLSGRICIASMLITASKSGALTALKYGNYRKAMGTSGLSDTPIAEFGLFQNQIYPLLSRTVILNAGFNTVKELYAQSLLNNQPASLFLVCLCCASKPIITWNARDLGTTITERVGGQGYLSVNRVSELLPFAHSGITAEGDNGVLMQKTAKELLQLVQQGKYEVPAPSSNNYDFTQVQTYVDLLRVREQKLIEEMINVTSEKMGEGKHVYEIWVKENNDIVQNLAKTFGERVISEFANERIKKTSGQLSQVLNVHLKLHLNLCVFRELGWYLYNDVITTQQAKQISQQHYKFIKNVHQYALKTVNSFGCPDHLMTAPISQSIETYNNGANHGEHKPKL